MYFMILTLYMTFGLFAHLICGVASTQQHPERGVVGKFTLSARCCQSIQAHMGEELLQDFINFCLNYMAKIKLPKKR